MPGFKVFGHRGARGHEPENTLLSIKKALSLNVKWIEIDVFNVQGELIVIHDERLDRTTNGKGYVSKSSIEYIRSLDAGKGEKIPFLSEVIELVNRTAGINIELKGRDAAGITADMIDYYINKENWEPDKFLVSSFNHHELKAFKELMPDINIGALTASLPLKYAEFGKDLKAYSIHASIEFINKRFVKDAHRLGMKFYVYTVNNFEDIMRLKEMNVDGVFTDYPEICKLDTD